MTHLRGGRALELRRGPGEGGEGRPVGQAGALTDRAQDAGGLVHHSAAGALPIWGGGGREGGGGVG